MLDITQLRADTPGCANVLHFNNAGASLMPRPVYEALTAHLALEYRIGGYEAAAEAAPQLAAMYDDIAALIGAQPGEIAFVENATRAWDMAFYGLPLQPGDRILTHGPAEYASNYLALLHQARRRGLEIGLIPSDETGQADASAIDALVTPRTRLIALTHIPTQGGLINPAAEVGRAARRHGLTYLLDACQSVGQLHIDVGEIGCDILSTTGRKFLRGPRGTGFLWVRRGLIEKIDPPFIDLHAATWTDEESFEIAATARRFENWESHVAGRLGLAAAARYAHALGTREIEARTLSLAAQLRAALNALPGVETRDTGARQSGIVTFTKAGHTPPDMVQALRTQSSNISDSTAANARFDLGQRNIPAVARASVHYFNTENEIDRFTEAVRAL